MKIYAILLGALALSAFLSPVYAQRVEQGQAIKESWSEKAPEILAMSLSPQDGNKMSIDVTLSPKSSSNVEVAYTVIDEEGVTLDLHNKTLDLLSSGGSYQDGATMTDNKVHGLRTVQMMLIDKSTNEVLGSQATLYYVLPGETGSPAVTKCLGIEQMCVNGFLAGNIGQREFSPMWGWLMSDDNLVYVGGADYVPLCHVGTSIVCSEEELAYVDARYGYDHALSLERLKAQSSSGPAYELAGVPSSLSAGDSVNISISGRYASVTAQLLEVNSADAGKTRLVAVDQATPATPQVAFRVPLDASGSYRIAITVLNHDGTLTPHLYDFTI